MWSATCCLHCTAAMLLQPANRSLWLRIVEYNALIMLHHYVQSCVLWYRIAAGGKFGESSVIHQIKTIQIFTYNYYPMAESIHSPNFSSPNAHNSEFVKLSRRQTFPLYGILFTLQQYGMYKQYTFHSIPL